MKIVSVILARGGSKGIPDKNIIKEETNHLGNRFHYDFWNNV